MSHVYLDYCMLLHVHCLFSEFTVHVINYFIFNLYDKTTPQAPKYVPIRCVPQGMDVDVGEGTCDWVQLVATDPLCFVQSFFTFLRGKALLSPPCPTQSTR